MEYYFISDLHIGGDYYLDVCDFEEELISFLNKISDRPNTELIIVGDAFGLREITANDGIKRLEKAINSHKRIFDTFRSIGDKIKITLIPGNHDHDLACFPECGTILKKYNIDLEPYEYISRDIGNKKIWIEHGHQHDDYSRIPDFGNPNSFPMGYYFPRKMIMKANHIAMSSKRPWLKDIKSVPPDFKFFGWLISNYFYKELNPLIRYAVVPFLFFLTFAFLVWVGSVLERFGLINSSFFSKELGQQLGIFGNIIDIIIFVDSFIILILLSVGIPVYLLYRDTKRFARRYGLSKKVFEVNKKDHFVKIAKNIFKQNPEYGIFIFGHTHRAFLEKIGNRAVVNTGTWLKNIVRVKGRARFLPAIYYSYYQLNYFHIYEENDKIAIDYHVISKNAKQEHTFLEKILSFGKKMKYSKEIPLKTYLK